MKILAIETATEACSAALLCDDEIIEQYEVAPRKHNELILPMCESVMSEGEVALTQLDAIAFGCGPGAFTGVRIATGVTQGIAFAHDLPVIPVSTLANLALQACIDLSNGDLVLPAIDARMEEIYWAIYKKESDSLVRFVLAERVQAPADVQTETKTIVFGLGSGWQSYQAILQQKTQLSPDAIDGSALPRARFTAELAKDKFVKQETVDAAEALPVYLRDNVVHQK